MDNTDEIIGLPSACDQSTQTEDVLDLTKEPSKENVFEKQGTTLPNHSKNETEVWLFIIFDLYLFQQCLNNTDSPQLQYFKILKNPLKVRNSLKLYNSLFPLSYLVS